MGRGTVSVLAHFYFVNVEQRVISMREVKKETLKSLDGVKQSLRALAALSIDESDPILFNHHLREIYNDAQGVGLSVDFESFKAAYEAEKGAPQVKPKPAGSPSAPVRPTTQGAGSMGAEKRV